MPASRNFFGPDLGKLERLLQRDGGNHMTGLMDGCPAEVPEADLRELHIRLC